jgi:hypothetical protein
MPKDEAMAREIPRCESYGFGRLLGWSGDSRQRRAASSLSRTYSAAESRDLTTLVLTDIYGMGLRLGIFARVSEMRYLRGVGETFSCAQVEGGLDGSSRQRQPPLSTVTLRFAHC